MTSLSEFISRKHQLPKAGNTYPTAGGLRTILRQWAATKGGRQAITYAVEFQSVSRLYSDMRAVDGVSIGIHDNEFLSMLGPSGLGKATYLRLVTGLEQLSGDTIRIFGQPAGELPPWQRDASMVFQDYTLFPRISTLDNVAYSLMVKSMAKKARRARARETLEKIALGFAHHRKPSQLSSGQRQWVVIARALISQSRVLLFNEPLSALSLKLCKQMQVELKKLQQSLGITFVFVTHGQNEVLSMSDRVAIFSNGRIGQMDTPQDLYLRPEAVLVAGFVGTASIFKAEAARRSCDMSGSWSLRPGYVRLQSGGEVQVQGIVQAVQYQGAAARTEFRLVEGGKLLVSQTSIDGAAAASVPWMEQTMLMS